MEQIHTQLHEEKVCEAYYSQQRICTIDTIDKEVEIKSIEKKINRAKARVIQSHDFVEIMSD